MNDVTDIHNVRVFLNMMREKGVSTYIGPHGFARFAGLGNASRGEKHRLMLLTQDQIKNAMKGQQ